MAQGGRFEEPRGRGVATYRAGKQAGGDGRRSLVFWVVSKQSVLCTSCRVVAVLLQAFSAFFCRMDPKYNYSKRFTVFLSLHKRDLCTILHVRVHGHALRHQQDPSQTYFSLILPETRRSDPAGPMKLPGWVGSRSLNMDSTLSFGPGLPAAMSISRVEKASPSAGFSHGACRLGVSWSQAQRRRLSD